MKGLTIHQPWASLICSNTPLPAGVPRKRIENRTWPTRYRGPMLVHSSLNHDAVQRAYVNGRRLYELDREWCSRQPHGVLLGLVELVDCFQVGSEGEQVALRRFPWLHGHPYADGPWCWVLGNARALVEPRPYTGSQGLWTVAEKTKDVLASVAFVACELVDARRAAESA